MNSEVEELKRRLEAMESKQDQILEALRSIVRHTERGAKSAELMANWDYGGLPRSRVTA
jgi:predicted translin family RNA/ssDNA-binding protein